MSYSSLIKSYHITKLSYRYDLAYNNRLTNDYPAERYISSSVINVVLTTNYKEDLKTCIANRPKQTLKLTCLNIVYLFKLKTLWCFI